MLKSILGTKQCRKIRLKSIYLERKKFPSQNSVPVSHFSSSASLFIYPVTDEIDYCCKLVSTISGLNNVNFDQQIKRQPKHEGVVEADCNTIRTLPNLSFLADQSL